MPRRRSSPSETSSSSESEDDSGDDARCRVAPSGDDTALTAGQARRVLLLGLALLAVLLWAWLTPGAKPPAGDTTTAEPSGPTPAAPAAAAP